jgi:hypothetical protein
MGPPHWQEGRAMTLEAIIVDRVFKKGARIWKGSHFQGPGVSHERRPGHAFAWR